LPTFPGQEADPPVRGGNLARDERIVHRFGVVMARSGGEGKLA